MATNDQQTFQTLRTYKLVFGNIDITSYLFSLLVFFGGLFAFIRTGSLMSLLSSIAFAGLLSVGSYKTSLNRKDYHFTISKLFSLMMLVTFDNQISILNQNNLSLPSSLLPFESSTRYLHLFVFVNGLQVFIDKQIHASRFIIISIDFNDLLSACQSQNS